MPVTTALMSEEWRKDAACFGLSRELFFSTYHSETKRAKAVCTTCPVRRECLVDSLNHQDRFGIFGGATHLQRRQALQIDREGHATANAKPIRCPLCGEKKINTLLKRRSWMRVECSNEECKLAWVAKRVVPRKKTESPEAGADDTKAVEGAL